MKKIVSFITSFVVLAACLMTFATVSCAEETAESKGVVILHTNDVHCGFEADDSTFGISELSAYKARLESEGYDVILVDAGDFIQGGVSGTLSDGEYPLQIMNELGYDIAVPGNHEFDYGMETFLKLSKKTDFPYLSVNFTDLRTGEKPFQAYKIIEADRKKIAFVGITTPETPSSTRPSNFMDENGNFIYGFLGGDDGTALYSAVQNAVDAAYADGADYVFAVGHMGDYVYDDRWSSLAVIRNVSGLNGFIDGHSHSVIEEIVKDKDGSDVPLASTGTKLQNIGQITITDNTFKCNLVEKGDYTVTNDEKSAEYAAFKRTADYLGYIDGKFSELVNRVVAKTDVNLTINNPDTGIRAVRNAETNLGDLCTDAFRTGTKADIALINGGGIRADIAAGDITYGQIIDVQPFGNSLCVVKASGQQILDCLEMGAMYMPEENGGFIQVSGLTYKINSYIPSSVTLDENGNFVGVDGEYRVSDVVIMGKPLELDGIYTVASYDYLLLNGGGGMTMFMNCDVVAKEISLDYQTLIDFITENLGGTVGDEYSNPRGNGRIVVVSKPDEESPATGYPNSSGSVIVFITAAGIAAAMMTASRKRK